MKIILKYGLLPLLLIASACNNDDAQPVPDPNPVVKNSEKRILSFQFKNIPDGTTTLNIAAEIDEAKKTIAVTLPTGTDVTTLDPEISISESAMIDPIGPRDFSEPLTYMVTAEDGSSVNYFVTVQVALSEKEILLILAERNRDFKLDWNINEDISKWDGVSVDSGGKVNLLWLINSGLRTITPEIGGLKSLEELYLQGNDLESLPAEIGELNNLKQLDISRCNLGSIPKEIGALKNLKFLHMGKNPIKQLPEDLKELANLKSLYLFNLELQDFPSQITSLEKLALLSLEGNSISVLPEQIGSMGSLTNLNLGKNNIVSLPSGIEKLVNLQTLSLDGNEFNEFPTILSSQGKLEELNFNNNKIEVLPEIIGEFSNLESLFLKANRLSSIPVQLSNLSNLRNLQLADNAGLKGLPWQVCQMDVSKGGNTHIDIIDEVSCILIGIPSSKN